MHIIKITPNLIFEYQYISGKFIRLPNRIEKNDSVAKIESNQIETFLPELECSNTDHATSVAIGRIFALCALDAAQKLMITKSKNRYDQL